MVAEAKQARAQQRRVLASPSRLTCRSLDQFAWSLATCYINERSLLEELGPNTIDRSTGRKHTADHGGDTDTDARLEELGPKTINERSLLEELGPNTIDRSTGREHTDDHGDDTDTDVRQHWPPLTIREQFVWPPLPNGPAPGTTPKDAAAANFASRCDFLRFMT